MEVCRTFLWVLLSGKVRNPLRWFCLKKGSAQNQLNRTYYCLGNGSAFKKRFCRKPTEPYIFICRKWFCHQKRSSVQNYPSHFSLHAQNRSLQPKSNTSCCFQCVSLSPKAPAFTSSYFQFLSHFQISPPLP